MRTHFGTFCTALSITKQTAERFRLQTANSTRQIRPVIFPISAFTPSAPREMVSFPALFRVLLLRFGRLNLRSILRMFFERARIVARHGGLYSLSAWRETPWSRSTSTPTSSRCPRSRTCCAWRLPCAGSRVGGRRNIRIADVAPRFRRGYRR